MNNPKLLSGLVLLVLVLTLAVAGPAIGRAMFPDEDPLGIGTYVPSERPSAQHLIGTDREGKDALVVFLNSIWPSFVIGLVAGLVATAVGVVVGFISGYLGGRVDTVLRTVVDMLLVIPTLPIFLAIGLFIPRWSLLTLALLLAAFMWPFGARTVRAQVLSLRERPHIDMARLSDEGHLEIVFLELLPSLLPYIGLSLSSRVFGAMLTEAGLQFVGFGAGGLSTLGFIIGQGFRRGLIGMGLYGQMLLPAAVLVLMFLALNLINMGLEETFNPRLQMTVQET